MRKFLLSLLGLVAMSGAANAACAVTNLQVKDNAAVVAAVPYADDGSGGSNCSPQIQIKQGGNVAGVDASGNLKVNVTTATGLAQGSTTSGQTGSLDMGAVTTAVPSYTNAQTSPLSLTTWGYLRVGGDDPCAGQTKTNFAVASSSGTTQIVGGSGSKKVYICNIFVVGATAWIGNIIEGTGAACATANEAAVIGSTTAGSGMSFSANSGWAQGTGAATVASTATAGNGICILQSGTAALAGNVQYVQQ